jgi:uncharacterized membrane protein SirB2
MNLTVILEYRERILKIVTNSGDGILLVIGVEMLAVMSCTPFQLAGMFIQCFTYLIVSGL